VTRRAEAAEAMSEETNTQRRETDAAPAQSSHPTIEARGWKEQLEDVEKIWRSTDVSGLERCWDVAIRFLQIITVGFWVRLALTRKMERPKAVDIHVIVRAVLLTFALFIFVQYYPRVCTAFAIYVLYEMYLALLNIVFISKFGFIPPVASIERSLLLLLINAAEINLAFATFYRAVNSNWDATQALATAVLVFATAGHPLPLTGPAPGDSNNWIVISQVALNFVFIAIVVGALAGQLRGFKTAADPHRSPQQSATSPLPTNGAPLPTNGAPLPTNGTARPSGSPPPATPST
jgi:hypothetical protein